MTSTLFNHLSESESNTLSTIPMYVGLLIASADGDIDEKELTWIEKITHFRIKTAHHSLRGYYGAAHQQIVDRMKMTIQDMPSETNDRVAFLASKVAEAKPILAKLDERTKERLEESYRSMALSVAEISGGILNFFSHNAEEEKWLQLEMLD